MIKFLKNIAKSHNLLTRNISRRATLTLYGKIPPLKALLHEKNARASLLQSLQATSTTFKPPSNATDHAVHAFFEKARVLRDQPEYRLSKQSVDFKNCQYLTDDSVEIVVEQWGDSLRDIRLQNCRKITDKAVQKIADHCPNLKQLDMSGCTAIQGKTILNLVASCPNLKDLRRQGTGIVCLETRTLGVEILREKDQRAQQSQQPQKAPLKTRDAMVAYPDRVEASMQTPQR